MVQQVRVIAAEPSTPIKVGIAIMPLKSQGCGEGDKGITGDGWLAGLAARRVGGPVSKE